MKIEKAKLPTKDGHYTVCTAQGDFYVPISQFIEWLEEFQIYWGEQNRPSKIYAVWNISSAYWGDSGVSILVDYLKNEEHGEISQ